MSLRRYLSRRAVDGLWFTNIPSDWDDLPVRRVFDLITEKGAESERKVALEHIESWTGKLVEAGEEFEGEGIAFKAGDILFGKLRPYLAKVFVAHFEGGAVGDFHVLRPKRLSPDFAGYVLRTAEFISVVNGSTIGAKMPRASWDYVSTVPVPVPSAEEQCDIVTFLDRETAKIDALVAEQERLIALLKEKRQAVISHAVTKGLDPTVPMKDSGIEWLGEVPAHWGVVALKRLVAHPIIDGPHVTPEKLDDGVPFVSAEAISAGYLDFNRKWGFISSEAHEEYSKRYKPKRGDILLVKLGATAGTPAIVDTDTDFNIWVPLAAIRLREEFEPEFFLNVLRSSSLKRAYELLWTYGTQQTLGLGTIGNLWMPVPPQSEQAEIFRHLSGQLPRLESLMSESQQAMDVLKERRAALISAAVTGQIDIRGLVDEEAAA